MNTAEVRVLVKLLRGAFPSFQPAEDVALSWCAVLADEDTADVMAAAVDFAKGRVSDHSTAFAPSTAQIISQAHAIQNRRAAAEYQAQLDEERRIEREMDNARIAQLEAKRLGGGPLTDDDKRGLAWIDRTADRLARAWRPPSPYVKILTPIVEPKAKIPTLNEDDFKRMSGTAL